MGIDLKIEPADEADEETLGDPHGFVGLLLGTAKLKGTRCLGFIDPYGNTIFNQLQIPVLIDEFKAALPEITTKRLRAYREEGLKAARRANWDATIVKEYETRSNASEFELKSELTKMKLHIEKVLKLLQEAANAGPHYFVRFIGD